MRTARPSEGQTVVVQFGPTDISFTRCETTQVEGPQIELRPIDPLSGSGHRGEPARLVFTGAVGRAHHVDAFCAEDITSSRVVVIPDRRTSSRQPANFTLFVAVDDETTVEAQLLDLSRGGLRAKVADKVPVGETTWVRIVDLRGVSTRFEAAALELSDGEVRMRFLDVSEFSFKRLERLIAGDDVEPSDSVAAN
jgi:hypothetical protein